VDDSAATLQGFAANLNSQIREQAADGEPYSSEVECFAHYVLELFEEAGVAEEPEVCVRSGMLGRAQWEIAGWAFPPSDDQDLSDLSVLVVLFNDDPVPQPLSATDVRRRCELGLHFVREMLAGRADELEPAADAAALGRIIHERRNQLRRVTVHLATDGLTQRLREIASEHIGKIEIAFSIWDIDRLSRLGDPKKEEIEVDIPFILDGAGLPCLRVPEEDPAYDAYLCVVPGTLLYRAYEQYGQRLLELNVRSFLSKTNKVNRGILETIQHQPDRFFPYNNGLALTARSVELRTTPSGGEEIVRIVGLQVVNGGQTTASIHRAWKLDGMEASVRKVFVQAKLTVITTPDDDSESFTNLVRDISKFANSQSAVKGDDLEANQPWHVAFEKLSRSVWAPDAESQWYYERARGSYTVEKAKAGATRGKKLMFERIWPRHQLVTKMDLAKAMNAWSQRPNVVSLGGQKNFVAFMEGLSARIQQPGLTDDEYKRVIGRVILFRETTKLVRDLGQRIPAYRANVVAYLISYLSFRMPSGLDFLLIWDKQDIPPAVKDTLSSWAETVYNKIVTSADGRNVTEWCKKPACWETVMRLDLNPARSLDRYASPDGIGERVGVVDNDEAANVAECISLPLEDWDGVIKWAMTANQHFAIQGILGTLRTQALHGWVKKPTSKQAKPAARVIRQWRKGTPG
jgi:AIPR protein/abortive infection phage resistance-like protein